MQAARKQVADAIHADAQEIYFTGCATEANNAVLKSLSNYFYPSRKKIVSLPIEHPSVIQTLEFLKTQGIVVEYCPVDRRGRVQLDELEKRIDGDTFLVCCMLANNEIGTIQDIGAVGGSPRGMARWCCPIASRHSARSRSTSTAGDRLRLFFGAQAVRPKGVGALYVKQGSPFAPFIHGGHQENGMRAGTESLHNIAGFGVACRDVSRLLSRAQRIRALKNRLIRRLRAVKADCVIHSPEDDGLPNTISVTFPQVNNAGLLAVLDQSRHRGVGRFGVQRPGRHAVACPESDRPVRPAGERDHPHQPRLRHLGAGHRLRGEGFRDFFKGKTLYRA